MLNFQKFLIPAIITIIFLFSITPFALAQENPNQNGTFYKAEVIKINKEGIQDIGDTKQLYQDVLVKILDGDEKNHEIEIQYGGLFVITDSQKVHPGDNIVVTKTQTPEGPQYFISDKNRLNPLFLIVGIFFFFTILFGRLKGLSSIFGLIFSVLIIAKLVVPAILAGYNPLFISLIGAFLIAIISIYLSHGVNRVTSIALFSTLLTLIISAFISILFVNWAKLLGLGSEEAFLLQMGPAQTINFKGLLLGGIIIGSLGVLDDITTAQAASINQIKRANPSLNAQELYRRGFEIGKEHIASLVNTLFLAYAGASLPLFLMFSLNNNQPFWVTLNSEFIAEEIVRTMVGSMTLVLAVPIATFFASYILAKKY